MRGSFLTRAARLAFGLQAVWCLGCTSLDSVLARILQGPAAVVDCMTVSASPAHATGAVVESAASRADDGCGCSHCVAVQAPGSDIAAGPQPTPETVQTRLGLALAVHRDPLMRPPISGRV
jgi:hypothetical protein